MADRRKMQKFMFSVFLTFLISCNCSFGEYIPVYVWGDISEASLSSSPSAFDKIKSTDFLENYLKPLAKDKIVLVFVQDTLSSEDLSISGKNPNEKAFSNLKTEFNKPSIILPNVNNPFPEIQSLKSSGLDISETDAADIENNNLENQDLKPRIIIVYLHPTSGDRFTALRKNDEAIGNVLKNFRNSKYVAIYTGMKPTVMPDPDYESHIRQVRAALEAEPSEAPTEKNFLNYTNGNYSIFYAYATNVTIQVISKSSEVNEVGLLQWPPTVTTTEADIINNTISLKWPFNKVGNFSDVSIDIEFTNNTHNGYWSALDPTINFKHVTSKVGEQSLTLKAPYTVGASKGFSFSCFNATFKFSNNTALDDLTVEFKIERFQVEFMPVKTVFSASFDCQTFFSIPLWMGLFVTILFTFILALGVFMLFEVKTMDRFDDPKGKTISVPLTD